MKHQKIVKTIPKNGGLKITTVVSKEKAYIREIIENEAIGQPYDVLDILADVSNALHDVIAQGNFDSATIEKFKDRREKIEAVLNGYQK